MRKISINITTEKILKLNLIKFEYKYKILKSILQNNNTPLWRKSYTQNLFYKLTKGKVKFSRSINTCLVTGSRHSITRLTSFSRQQNKRFFFTNHYNGFKISN